MILMSVMCVLDQEVPVVVIPMLWYILILIILVYVLMQDMVTQQTKIELVYGFLYRLIGKRHLRG